MVRPFRNLTASTLVIFMGSRSLIAAAVAGGISPAAGPALPTAPKAPRPAVFRKFLRSRCFVMINLSLILKLFAKAMSKFVVPGPRSWVRRLGFGVPPELATAKPE